MPVRQTNQRDQTKKEDIPTTVMSKIRLSSSCCPCRHPEASRIQNLASLWPLQRRVLGKPEKEKLNLKEISVFRDVQNLRWGIFRLCLLLLNTGIEYKELCNSVVKCYKNI